MIIASIIIPSFMVLLLIMAFFGWIGITWVMRTMTYKEKEKEYVLAVRSLGASHARIVFRHIIPNTLSVIVTYAPFAVSGGIVALTSLDYLGFGLPAPTPSWGGTLIPGLAEHGSLVDCRGRDGGPCDYPHVRHLYRGRDPGSL